ncbi:hypothetical protein [Spiroplasma cantharicola]|nr:hypothetical protein [Spiroplasma cantharicola]
MISELHLIAFKETMNLMFWIVGNYTMQIKSFYTLFGSIFMSF